MQLNESFFILGKMNSKEIKSWYHFGVFYHLTTVFVFFRGGVTIFFDGTVVKCLICFTSL